MLRPRVIPCLLYRDAGLVKTRRFREPVYVGDPINTARIFNDSEADELIVLDIGTAVTGRGPELDMIARVASECFMPVTYGGGVTDPDQVAAILKSGVEKVSINTAAFVDPSLLRRCADRFGRQAVVGSIDYRVAASGRAEVFASGGRRPTGMDPVEAAVRAEACGAGEVLLGAIDRDGTMSGYDLEVLRAVTSAVSIPVIASGGAGGAADLRQAVLDGGASAVAVGSYFVFHGPHRAVLISYSTPAERERLFG